MLKFCDSLQYSHFFFSPCMILLRQAGNLFSMHADWCVCLYVFVRGEERENEWCVRVACTPQITKYQIIVQIKTSESHAKVKRLWLLWRHAVSNRLNEIYQTYGMVHGNTQRTLTHNTICVSLFTMLQAQQTTLWFSTLFHHVFFNLLFSPN